MTEPLTSQKSRKAKSGQAGEAPIAIADVVVAENFVAPIEITKSETIRRMVSLARRARLDYEGFKYVTREVRGQLGLQRPAKRRKLPRLLTGDELTQLVSAIDGGGVLVHRIMFRVLLYTGVRVGELVAIQRADVDLGNNIIRIERGKGGKDRQVLFPESFRLALSAYMGATPANKYLFETRRKGPFTARRVQQLAAYYGRDAHLEARVHPHLFRHQALTSLTRDGLTDAQIQVVSGHASKRALETYQHLGLAAVSEDYQRSMRGRLL